jgi:mevalonate kinase
LDHIFHGTASGIDTATSFSGGLVKAQSAGPGAPRHFEPLANARPFYIALVDTGERSQTAAMVESLAQRKRQQPVFVGEKIGRLGELAAASTTDLREGRLAELGSHLNEAHEHLSDLGMSTPDLDRVVLNLRELGALGAKLTGSGGGGFALGLFRDYPQWVESYLPAKGAVYVSEVPAVSVQECQRRASGFAPAGSTDIKPEREH